MTVKIYSVVPLSATDKKTVSVELEKAEKGLENCNLKLVKDKGFYKLETVEKGTRAFFRGHCYKRGDNVFLKIIDKDIIIFNNNINVSIKETNILMLSNGTLFIIG